METSLSVHRGSIKINGVEVETVTDLKIHASPAGGAQATITFDVINLDADFEKLSQPSVIEKGLVGDVGVPCVQEPPLMRE